MTKAYKNSTNINFSFNTVKFSLALILVGRYKHPEYCFMCIPILEPELVSYHWTYWAKKRNSMQLYSCCTNLLADMHSKILTHWSFSVPTYTIHIFILCFSKNVMCRWKFLKPTTTKMTISLPCIRTSFVRQSTIKYYSTITKGKPLEAVEDHGLYKCAVAKKQICLSSSNQIAQLSNAAGLGQEANSTSHKLRNSLELFVADRWLNPSWWAPSPLATTQCIPSTNGNSSMLQLRLQEIDQTG